MSMSLSVCCFASGSKGNCCLVTDGETNLLIDLGISASRAELCLRAVGVDPDSVHVLVTHSHSDHVAGIKVFCKKHPKAAVHCQNESRGELVRTIGFEPIVDARDMTIGGITLSAVPVPHDVPCFGYVISSKDRSVAIVTDVGAIKEPTLDRLCGCGLVVLEANHDPEMLRNNRNYSGRLKMRIASTHGHLSNPDCARACAYLAGRGVRNFILAHLSEDNNDPVLAAATVTRGIESAGIFDARVVCASQNKPTGMYEIC